MTKTAIIVLLISTGVDFLMGFSGALTTAMLATENGALPNWPALVFACLTGLTASAKSIQPVLKAMLHDFGLQVNGEASAVVKAAAKVT